MSIVYTYEDIEYTMDSLYRNMIFSDIWDSKNLSPKERMVAIMIYRQTIHFNKIYDNISMHRIATVTGIKTPSILRSVIEILESKAVIEVEKSTGGYDKKDPNNYNRFSLSEEIRRTVFFKWMDIKEEKRFGSDVAF